MLHSRFLLVVTLLLFFLIVANVFYVLLSFILMVLNFNSLFIQPVLIVLIPLLLIFCMLSMFFSCDYERNVNFFMGVFKHEMFDLFLYGSAYMLNPLLLFVYTKSYKQFVRIWGIVRCLPIVNIYLYWKIIKLNNNFINRMTNSTILVLYLKGKLLFTIVNQRMKIG